MTQKFTEEEVRANIAANRRYMTTETELQLTAYADILSKPADSADRAQGEATDDRLASMVKVASAVVEGQARWAFIAQWDAEIRAFVTIDPIGPLDVSAATPSQPADSGRVADPIIAGALFDLMGFLTTRDEAMTLSGHHEASSAVQALEAFAAKRGLQLDEANVAGWRAALAAQGQRDGEPVAWRIDTDDDVERVAKSVGWDNRRYMTPADYAIWCSRMREFVRLAAGHAAPPAAPAGVPDGWVLVPLELTREMSEAFFRTHGEVAWLDKGWAAALAAAPSAPEGDGGAE